METMTSENQSTSSRARTYSIAFILLAVICIAIAGGVLVIVSNTFQWKSSDFTTLPTASISTTGAAVTFVNVGPITHSKHAVAVGVEGYLETGSGSPVVGAQVYLTYYFEGAYRTQVATTDQNGYFQVTFPMNWTGWLPLTVTYFGDSQHRGLTRVESVAGESLEINPAAFF
jgi:hypothetical protein